LFAAAPLKLLAGPANFDLWEGSRRLQMLGKLSTAGALAAVLMTPTPLSAQGVGGAVNAGAAVRGAVVQGIPTPADLERSSRSASQYRSIKKQTTRPRRRQ
jgi:hypothetical protein